MRRHPFLSPTMAVLIGLTALAPRPSYAQAAADPAPQPLLAYQGRVMEGTAPVTGSRIFTFAMLDSNGQELWNSGNQALDIEAGLYGIVLGSTGMPPIPAGLLSRSHMRLHITLSGMALTPDVDIIPALQARSAWELTGPLGGDVSGIQNATLLMNLQGTPLDLTSTPPTAGQALVFNGSKWIASSVAGTPGPAGPTGPQGATGSQGPLGPQGLTGLIGPTGAAGPAGVNGINGTNGLDGNTTWNGAGTPVATNAGGTSGDFYLDTTSNLLYGPKVGPSWVGIIGVSLVGPSGANGPQGLMGPAGPQGPTGLIGATGVQGPIGPAGATGSQGPIGVTGANGLQGPIGLPGATGVQGPIGPAGATGSQGPIGATGANGLQGPIGLTGAPGAQGPIGPAGATGSQGPIGATGPQGPSGLLAFGYFYALMPSDNTTTVAAGSAVSFPQNGAASGITRLSAGEFTLSAAGTYEVFWQVSIAEAGQLVLGINGTEQAYTVAGRATATSQITNHVLLVTTLPNSLLSVRNPSGNPVALTVTPSAGGALAVSASLLIKQIQ